MLGEKLRLVIRNAKAFKERHAITKAAVAEWYCGAWLESGARPPPRRSVTHEIVNSRVIPKRSIRFRNVARVMPSSFAARTWFPFVAFIA